jgi:hypothetical protein
MAKLGISCGTSVDAILALNPGVTPGSLQVGQAINVPCSCPLVTGEDKESGTLTK